MTAITRPGHLLRAGRAGWRDGGSGRADGEEGAVDGGHGEEVRWELTSGVEEAHGWNAVAGAWGKSGSWRCS